MLSITWLKKLLGNHTVNNPKANSGIRAFESQARISLERFVRTQVKTGGRFNAENLTIQFLESILPPSHEHRPKSREWLRVWDRRNLPPFLKEIRIEAYRAISERLTELKAIERQKKLDECIAISKSVLDNNIPLIERFLEISYRKVAATDEYGDQNLGAFDTELTRLVRKLRERQPNLPDLNRQFCDDGLNPTTQLVILLRDRFREYCLQRQSTPAEVSCEAISRMTGVEFEVYLCSLFRGVGISDISTTPHSGDQGADILFSWRGSRYAIQAKRYSASVGNKAIQEAHAAKGYYRCNEAWVITNSLFTSSARALANELGVVLVDAGILANFPRFLRTQFGSPSEFLIGSASKESPPRRLNPSVLNKPAINVTEEVNLQGNLIDVVSEQSVSANDEAIKTDLHMTTEFSKNKAGEVVNEKELSKSLEPELVDESLGLNRERPRVWSGPPRPEIVDWISKFSKTSKGQPLPPMPQSRQQGSVSVRALIPTGEDLKFQDLHPALDSRPVECDIDPQDLADFATIAAGAMHQHGVAFERWSPPYLDDLGDLADVARAHITEIRDKAEELYDEMRAMVQKQISDARMLQQLGQDEGIHSNKAETSQTRTRPNERTEPVRDLLSKKLDDISGADDRGKGLQLISRVQVQSLVKSPSGRSERLPDQAEAALRRVRARASERHGQLELVLDPRDLEDLATIALSHMILYGISTKRWSQPFIHEVGNWANCYLDIISEDAREMYDSYKKEILKKNASG